jgi:hypothetical protein
VTRRRCHTPVIRYSPPNGLNAHQVKAWDMGPAPYSPPRPGPGPGPFGGPPGDAFPEDEEVDWSATLAC